MMTHLCRDLNTPWMQPLLTNMSKNTCNGGEGTGVLGINPLTSSSQSRRLGSCCVTAVQRECALSPQRALSYPLES